jgi:hypothetical protein
MRFLILFGTLFLALNAGAETPASSLWTELKTKREKLPSLHQEFEITQTYKTATNSQSSQRQIVLDMSQGQWREKSSSGSGDYIRIFDGKDLFLMEDRGDEYVRPKRRSKGEDSLPFAYTLENPDLSNLAEVDRRPCGLPDNDHVCVILQGRLKTSVRAAPPNRLIRVVDGTARFTFDTETGLLIASRTIEAIDNGRITYQSDVTRVSRRAAYGSPPDMSLFKLPSKDIREVKELFAVERGEN